MSNELLSESYDDFLPGIHRAIQAGERSLLENLINSSTELEVRDVFGLTPLHFAVRCAVWRKDDGAEIVALLLSKGANRLCETYSGNTAVNDGECANIPNIVKLLRATEDELEHSTGPEIQAESKAAGKVANFIAQAIWRRSERDNVGMQSYMQAHKLLQDIVDREQSNGQEEHSVQFNAVMKLPEMFIQRHLNDLCSARVAEVDKIRFWQKELENFNYSMKQVAGIWQHVDRNIILRDMDLGNFETFLMPDLFCYLFKVCLMDRRVGVTNLVLHQIGQHNDELSIALLRELKKLRPSKILIAVEAESDAMKDIMHYYETPWSQFVEEAQSLAASSKINDLRENQIAATKRQVLRHIRSSQSDEQDSAMPFTRHEPYEATDQYIRILEDLDRIITQTLHKLENFTRVKIDPSHAAAIRDGILKRHATNLFDLQPVDFQEQNLLTREGLAGINSSIQRQARKDRLLKSEETTT